MGDIMATNTTSLSNTPQAGDDYYKFYEDQLTGNIVTLNVMSNDLGGNAKKLFSIEADSDTLNALLTTDVGKGWQYTAGGNQIQIVDGQIQLDISHALSAYGGNVNGLAAGDCIEDSFVYTIKLGNGTLSYATVTFKLIGQNDTPTDIALSANSVDENAAGAVIGALTTTDADTGETFTYTVDDVRFEVVNGELKLKAGQSLDSESEPTVTLQVTSTDSSSASITEQFVINVNDLDEVAPTITSGDTATAIDENSGAGQVVYTVTSDDTADISAGVTYSLKPVDDFAAFTIDENSGEVTLTGNPDEESQSSYSFTVLADDGVNTPTEQAVTLAINDVNEVNAITDTNAAANSVSETAVVGSVVGITANATDSEGDAITYSLTDSANGRFAINALTGVVTVASALDLEYASSHTITVQAADALGATQSMSFTISVTDVVADTNDTYIIDPIVDRVDINDTNGGQDRLVFQGSNTVFSILNFENMNDIVGQGQDDLQITWQTPPNGDTVNVVDHYHTGGSEETIEYLDFAGGASYAGYALGGVTYTISTDDSTPFTGTTANDLIAGKSSADTLNGLAGNDLLFGNGGNDILVGGAGNDLLVGGTGADTFKWNSGDQGTVTASAVDTIADFDPTMAVGTDKLDLQSVLTGEHNGTGVNPINLDSFLDFHFSGGNTTIDVKPSAGAVTQQIVLYGADITNNGAFTDSQIITNLLANGKLITDV